MCSGACGHAGRQRTRAAVAVSRPAAAGRSSGGGVVLAVDALLFVRARAGVGSRGCRGRKVGWRLKEKLTYGAHLSAIGGREK